MNTTKNESKSYVAVATAFLVVLGLVLQNPVMAYAHEGRDGLKRGNPPGPVGGAGRGPAWRDNPHRDNPRYVDNPPGPRGGRGRDGGRDEAGRLEGSDSRQPGTRHPARANRREFLKDHPRRRAGVAEEKLHRAEAKRARLAEEGGNEERLAKMDEKISNWKTKMETLNEKIESRKDGAEAVSETTGGTTTE